ncbi:MAG: DUF1273 family protein [Alistipes sp.]|nr:DUF1273 family protein [Alistipes sp.]
MENEKSITVAFTGHRTYQGEAEVELKQQLEALYERGFRRFLTGMAWGFDLAAGVAVVELKKRYADVELVAVEPYLNFRMRFKGEDLALYDRVRDAADEVVQVCQSGSMQAYFRRNDYLTDNASIIVAWWNWLPKSGTEYTVKRARKRGLEVINLFPTIMPELF